MTTVVWSASALAQLTAIYEHIAADSPPICTSHGGSIDESVEPDQVISRIWADGARVCRHLDTRSHRGALSANLHGGDFANHRSGRGPWCSDVAFETMIGSHLMGRRSGEVEPPHERMHEWRSTQQRPRFEHSSLRRSAKGTSLYTAMINGAPSS